MADENERARRAFAKFLKDNKLSGRAVSEKGGLSPSAASQYINGNARSPKAETFRKFAIGASELLGREVTPEEMTNEKRASQGGTGSDEKRKLLQFPDDSGDLSDDALLPRRPDRRLAAAIPITGEVAAGQWLDLDVEMDPRDFEQFPIAADPAYPYEAQYGLIVRGNSMNRVFTSGEVLHCLDVWKASVEPEEDDIVIVERIRAQASQREVTAKRITKRGKLIVLSPDSTEAKWKPIEFNPKDGHDGDEEVRVVAVVLATYRPIRKRK